MEFHDEACKLGQKIVSLAHTLSRSLTRPKDDDGTTDQLALVLKIGKSLIAKRIASEIFTRCEEHNKNVPDNQII